MGNNKWPSRMAGRFLNGAGGWWWAALGVGVALRMATVIIPGNHLYSPWSGGGDAPSYVLLAKNLLHGRGYTYASIPTAFRPPLYPLLLTSLMWLFGSHWLIALRWVQFLLGMGTVLLVYQVGRRLFGTAGGRAALLICLFFPTLAFTTSEVLPACLAVFWVALFLEFLFRQIQEGDRGSAAGMGVMTSLAGLTRFNLAALIAPTAWATLAHRDHAGRLQRLVLACLISLAVVSPWMVRNWIVFGDRLVFGTTSGYAALESVFSPGGRAQTPETRQLKISGWMSYELETNSPVRRTLPSEPQLSRRDWRITFHLWRQKGWGMLPILGQKLAYFWLSTDQLLHVSHFGRWVKVGRMSGVVAYWIALFLAVFGWLGLRSSSPPVARLVVFYATLLTVLILPFATETRHRVPMMDPLIAALAGGGWIRAMEVWNRRGRATTSPPNGGPPELTTGST